MNTLMLKVIKLVFVIFLLYLICYTPNSLEHLEYFDVKLDRVGIGYTYLAILNLPRFAIHI